MELPQKKLNTFKSLRTTMNYFWSSGSSRRVTMPEIFTVKKTPHRTYTSFNLDGKPLVTSATEHQCFHMTHAYLKNFQEAKASYTKTKSAKTPK